MKNDSLNTEGGHSVCHIIEVRMKTFQYTILVVLVLFALSAKTKADSLYVWCGDGTVHGFPTNGVSTALTNDFSGGNGPVGLTFDNIGNLYIGQPSASYVWLFMPSELLVLFGNADSVSGLAFNSSGKLIATIPNYGEITQLTFFGDRYYLYGQYTQSHLNYPTSLAFDDLGNMYVANSFPSWGNFYFPSDTNMIQKFSNDFTYLGAFATNLNQPWGLAFNSNGNLFVSNSGTNGLGRNSILKFLPDGTRSTFASAASGLNRPCGLAFDSAGNLFVANAGAGNILKFDSGGAVSIFATDLNSPTSIAIYPGLKVYSVAPVVLTNSTKLPSGNFQLNLVEPSGLNFTVVATTNLSLAISNWADIGNFTETSPNQYQFIDTQATNNNLRFYRVRSQ